MRLATGRTGEGGEGEGRARATTRPDVVGVVLCRGLEGGLAASVKGVWFIAHQCACFVVEAPALGYHQLAGPLAHAGPDLCAVCGRLAGYLSTQLSRYFRW